METDTPRESIEPRGWDAEALAALRLLGVDGIGSARLRALRRAFGGALPALDASALEVAEVVGMSIEAAGAMLAAATSRDIDRERQSLERAGVRPVLEGGTEYPALLLASHDPPPLLFVSGILQAEPEPAVAIVGSRRASGYGRMQAGRLAADLAARGVTVLSGGARGIDAEAHRGALRAGGRTIAVVATGCDHPYPVDHVGLFDAIIDAGGCTVGEQPPSVMARPDLFPRRNRMIAALALVTVVVEAAARSGALLTARIAVEDLSREAGCVPGPVDSVTSEGCHRAIREGWAQLVASADDICELIDQARTVALGAREVAERAARPVLAKRRGVSNASSGAVAGRCASLDAAVRELAPDARAVLDSIAAQKRAGLDELELALGWTVPRLATATLQLEIAGVIERDAEGAFRLVGVGSCGQ